MARKIESAFIAGPSGRLEALLEEPEEGEPSFAALVCHPHPKHGGTMHNKVVYRMARGLRRAGAVVLRFNYRGVNLSEGVYDNGAGEINDAGAALAWLRDRYAALPYVLAGFSFGSRIVLKLGCADKGASLVIPCGFPTRYADTHEFTECPVRRVFVQSTNDEYAARPAVEDYFATVRGEKELIWVEAKDHFFAGALDHLEETFARLAQAAVGAIS